MGGHEGHAQKKWPCLGWNGISKELIQKKWEKITVEVAMKHLQRNGKNLHKWIYLVICEASNTPYLFDVSDGEHDWKVLHIQVIIYLIWTLSQLVYFLSLTLTRVELKIDKLVWSLHTFPFLTSQKQVLSQFSSLSSGSHPHVNQGLRP